jgi:hypothetical protein
MGEENLDIVRFRPNSIKRAGNFTGSIDGERRM